MVVLIYYKRTDIQPIGGPSGYLFNLLTGWEKMNSEIELSLLKGNIMLEPLKKRCKSYENPIVIFFLNKYRRFKFIKSVFKSVYSKEKTEINLDDYDIIHFHSTQQLYLLRDELEYYKGKILLTSHSPQPLFEEYKDAATKLELKLLKRVFMKLVNMDRYAFRRADYIVFPTIYSDEPYLNSWEEYTSIKNTKKESIKYFLTGTIKAQPKKTRTDICKLYNIPQNAFIITYVGRHNEVKGYDCLVEVCMRFIENQPNTYVLVAGSKGNIKAPTHERWIEVGWTNDPHSIINAGDLFLLPNRETYFDLVLLEVLSLGKVAIASNTGGNKFFSDCKGVLLFDDNEQLYNLLKRIYSLDAHSKCKLEKCNMKLFEEKFTIDIFAKNYQKLLEEIV